jgi:hypothetical protein
VASYSPGDQVVCLIRSGVIVLASEIDYDLKFVFEILSQYESGYMIYVPITAPLKDAINITQSNYKKFKVDKKYIGSSVYYITEYKIVRAHKKLDGMCCAICGDFYAMAKPNQPDGTLKCWSCRKYPFYR